VIHDLHAIALQAGVFSQRELQECDKRNTNKEEYPWH
jgi:hypothetical protein